MPTSRSLAAWTLLFTLLVLGACRDERDWSRCNETTTDCRPGLVCDVAAARCVPSARFDAGSAPDSAPVRCSGNASCPAATPVCGPDGVCVACLAPSDCKDAARAFCVANRCVGCQMAGAGACTGATPACDSTTGRCVQCTDAAAHCRADPGKTFCVANVCSGCQGAGAGACKGATPACEATSGKCVQCTDPAMHCSADPGKAFCVANMCAGCGAAGAGACKRATPACETTSGRCVQCTDASHCAADPMKAFCVANACVGCQAAGAGACKDPTPACAGSGRCVECVTSADCRAPGKPICDTAMNKCIPCATDAQCAAKGGGPGVCMFHDGGRCASDAETIYVERSGTCAMTVSPTGGTSAMPYCLAQTGVDAVTPTRRVVVLRGPLTSMTVTNSGPVITVVGQMAAALEPGAAGPGVQLNSGDLYLRGVAIRRGSFEGVVAEAAGTLRMNRCVVEGNAKGGILLKSAGFDITNTVVAGNGPGDDPTGQFQWGGVLIQVPGAGRAARFANNTVVGNNVLGLSCNGKVDTPGLIAYGTPSPGRDIAPACMAPVCCTGDPLLTPTYRLMSGSPCIDKVPANMSAPDDIDGEARPKGAASDCGADEL